MDVKCSLDGQMESHTSTLPGCRAVLAMGAGESCCCLGRGEPWTLGTDPLHSEPRPHRLRLAFSFLLRHSPSASGCSCTEPARGQSLAGTPFVLTWKGSALLCSHYKLGQHHKAQGRNLRSRQQPLFSKCLWCDFILFLILI